MQYIKIYFHDKKYCLESSQIYSTGSIYEGQNFHFYDDGESGGGVALIKYQSPDYNITISLMGDQQSESFSEILLCFDSVLNGPLLAQAEGKWHEKLINLTKCPDQFHFLLKVVKKSLKSTKAVVIRLKLLCLLQELLSRQNQEENIEKISSIIDSHEITLKKLHPSPTGEENVDACLHVNVQLPYLTFLRKLAMWQSADVTVDDRRQIDFGFSMINKMKEVMGLRRIFHLYGCYYPAHRYAINIFRACLRSVRQLWGEICLMVKEVTLEALQSSSVLGEEYLFICAAEEAQDLLMEFAYCGYFSKKIAKDEKIKYVTLLKPEIEALEVERRRGSAEQEVMRALMVKRESRRSLDKEAERTGYSENVDEKLNTEMQMEILDSILCLESMLQ